VTTTASRAYDQLFQSFGLKENPFRSSQDGRYFFVGRSYETAFAELMFGIESRGGLLVLAGEPGTGKTMLLRRLLQWLGQRKSSSAYIFHSHLNTTGLFGFIAKGFGIAIESTKKSELLAAIQKWLQSRQSEGDSPVIVIDEAQALSTRALSELCLLLNLENSSGKLVQIVLAGQPALEERLRQPELRQLRQRIAVRCRIPLLTLEETEEYLEARLKGAGCVNRGIFPAESIQSLYSYAQGIPRLTNVLCEKALMAAYVERHTVVSPVNVRHAAAELDFAYEPSPGPVPEISLRPGIVVPTDPPALEPHVDEPVDNPPPLPLYQEASADTVTAPAHSAEEPSSQPQPAVPLPAMQLPTSIPEARVKPNVRVFAPKPPVYEPPRAETPAKAAEPKANLAPKPARRVSRPQSAFRRYWSDVARSFVRDCRYFFSAFRTQSDGDGKVLFMKKYDLRRDLVAPVSRWLSKPVNLKGSNSRPADSERRASRGHF
jgi:general secretion pathway protein A